jgi:hypothetical protein
MNNKVINILSKYTLILFLTFIFYGCDEQDFRNLSQGLSDEARVSNKNLNNEESFSGDDGCCVCNPTGSGAEEGIDYNEYSVNSIDHDGCCECVDSDEPRQPCGVSNENPSGNSGGSQGETPSRGSGGSNENPGDNSGGNPSRGSGGGNENPGGNSGIFPLKLVAKKTQKFVQMGEP